MWEPPALGLPFFLCVLQHTPLVEYFSYTYINRMMVYRSSTTSLFKNMNNLNGKMRVPFLCFLVVYVNAVCVCCMCIFLEDHFYRIRHMTQIVPSASCNGTALQSYSFKCFNSCSNF